ncbi:MAG: CARDB domain-containing protein [Candidatus Thermoplasmatota archaeon]
MKEILKACIGGAIIFCLFLCFLPNFSIDVEAAPGKWSNLSSMPTARSQLGLATLGGKIYAIGGFKENLLNTVEIYSPTSDSWVGGPPLPEPRYAFKAVTVNNKIYAFLGCNGTGVANKTLEYDPSTGKWAPKKPMPTERYRYGIAVVNDKIYVIGGDDIAGWSGGFYPPSAVVEVYDPANDSWTPKKPMPTARTNLGLAVIGGKIYAIGGGRTGSSSTNINEVYDTVSDSWTTDTSMPIAVTGMGIGVVNNKIYVIGGLKGVSPPLKATPIVQEYNPATRIWSEKVSMLAEREDFGWTVLDNKIYVIGGSGPTNKNEVFDPLFMPPPTLTLPEQNAQTYDQTPKFEWSAVPEALKYQIRIYDSPELSSPIIDETVDTINYTPSSPLTPEKTYYWQVRSNDGDVWGEYSPSQNFKILELKAPSLTTPLNNSDIGADKSLLFSWQAVEGAEKYQIQIDDELGFSSPLIDEISTTISYSYSKNLSKEKAYYWRVRGVVDDTFGIFSSVWNFKLVLPAPILVSPDNGSTVSSKELKFEWRTVNDAKKYNILIDDSKEFNSPELNATTLNNTYIPEKKLVDGKKYYWKVRAKGEIYFGIWSEVWEFETKPLPATIPDLTPIELKLSQTKIYNGDRIKISVNVYNRGTEKAKNVDVKFYVDKEIIGNFTINELLSNKTKKLETSWTAKKGNHTIVVNVDPNDLVTESDDYNNQVSKDISVLSESRKVVGIDLLFPIILAIVIICAVVVGIVAFLLIKKKKPPAYYGMPPQYPPYQQYQKPLYEIPRPPEPPKKYYP